MSELSRPKNNKALRQTYQVDFSGLNHRKGATDGEIYDMENMTSTHYPVLSPRGKRYDIEWGEDDGNAYAFIVYEGKLIQTRKDGNDWYIDVNGTLFKFEGDIAEQNKLKFIIMNNRAILYPMGWYVNLKSLESLDTFNSVDEIDIEDPQENDIVTVIHTYAEGFVKRELYYWAGNEWAYFDDESGEFERNVTSGVQLPNKGMLFESSATANTIIAKDAGFPGWNYYFKVGDAIDISGSKFKENNKSAVIKEIDGNTMRFYEDTFRLDYECSAVADRYMPYLSDPDDPTSLIRYYIKVFDEWYWFIPVVKYLNRYGQMEIDGIKEGVPLRIPEYTYEGESQAGKDIVYMEVDTKSPFYYDEHDRQAILCHKTEQPPSGVSDIEFKQLYVAYEEAPVWRYKVDEFIIGGTVFGITVNGETKYFKLSIAQDAIDCYFEYSEDADTMVIYQREYSIDPETQVSVESALYYPAGTVDKAEPGETGDILDFVSFGHKLNFAKTLPRMDFVFTSNNRVWGGKGDNLYASKLGDGSNFNVFEGLSTDSYSVELSGSGDITGGIEYNGYPTFFKENSIHKLYGDNPSNYQLMTTMTQGVKKECGGSLAVAGEVLYYISKSGVMAYNGGAPVYIGDPIGRHLESGIGSTDGRKYYLSATDGADAKLYVYDTYYRMWHIEDNKNFFAMHYDDVLYAGYIKDGVPGIVTLSHDIAPAVDGDIEESDVDWFVQFADFVIGSPFKKGVAKMNIRLDTSGGGEGTVYIRFDHEAEWDEVATFGQGEKHSEILPIVPKRGDNFTIKIIGTGIVDIYGLTVQYYHGSEI